MSRCKDSEIKSKEEVVLLPWADTSPFMEEDLSSSGPQGAPGGKSDSGSLIFDPGGAPSLAFLGGVLLLLVVISCF